MSYSLKDKTHELTYGDDHLNKSVPAGKASIVETCKMIISEMLYLESKRSKVDIDYEILDFMDIELLPILSQIQTLTCSYATEKDYDFLSKVFYHMPPRNPRMVYINKSEKFKDKDAFFDKKREVDAYNDFVSNLSKNTRFDRDNLGSCKLKVLMILLEKKMYIIDSHYGSGCINYYVDDVKHAYASENTSSVMALHKNLLTKITDGIKKYTKIMDDYKASSNYVENNNFSKSTRKDVKHEKETEFGWRSSEYKKTPITVEKTDKSNVRIAKPPSESGWERSSQRKSFDKTNTYKTKDEEKMSWRMD